MFDVLHKYHAGDTGLVREINANAAFNAGVNQMAREELGMPAEAQPQLQVIGMQYLGSLVQGMQITTQQLEVSNRQVEMSGRLVQSLTLERDGLALERSGLMTLATQVNVNCVSLCVAH